MNLAITRLSPGSKPPVAYLVNQYPKVSHSFIRREIAALEALGRPVRRFSIRPAEALVDHDDLNEQQRTDVLLRHPLRLLGASIITVMFHPRKAMRAMQAARAMGRRSPRGVWVHLMYLAEACLLYRLMQQEGITHVHAHFGTNPAAVARLCSMLGGVTFSFTVHGPEEFEATDELSLPDKIADAMFVVAISEHGRGQLQRCCNASDAGKIQVVRCGLDETYFNEDAQGSSTEGQGLNSRTLVCVGRLSEQKGHRVLLDAVAMLHDRGVTFHLELVGDGEQRSEIERRIAELNLGNRVTITGWRSAEEVREHLRAARGLVLASFAEGLPVVLMEALALGRPVVSTDVAGIPELVTPDCGWLVAVGNAGALADAMQGIMKAERRVLEAMGDAGRARVCEQHRAATEARKLDGLFSPVFA